MDRNEAIKWLEAASKYFGLLPCEFWQDNKISEALEFAIEALERELEYGQMVVDFTKGETINSDEWKYDTTCDAESATTTDCISRADIEYHTQLEANGNGQYEEVEVAYKSDIDNLPPVTPIVSEDCISRQALIDEVLEDGNGAVLSYTKGMDEDELVERIEKQMIKHFIGVIEYAPPVTPTERTGEWAAAYLDHESVGVRPRTLYCSECNWLTSFPSAWCPNCGAKMKGGTE